MKNLIISCISVTLVSGCAITPTGPSVLVLPGNGKSFLEFQQGEIVCRNYASQQIGGSTENLAEQSGVRTAALGTLLGVVIGAAAGGSKGAATGAAVGLGAGSLMGAEASSDSRFSAQRRYNNAYIQCMYAYGHRVPVPASAASLPLEANQIVSKTINIPPPPPGLPPGPPPTR